MVYKFRSWGFIECLEGQDRDPNADRTIWEDIPSRKIEYKTRLHTAKPAGVIQAHWSAAVQRRAMDPLIAITKGWRKRRAGSVWKCHKVRGSSERTQQPNLGASGPGRLPTPLEQRRTWAARRETPPTQFSKKITDQRRRQVETNTSD